MNTLGQFLNRHSLWCVICGAGLVVLSLTGLYMWPILSKDTQLTLHDFSVIPAIYAGWIILLCCIYRRWGK